MVILLIILEPQKQYIFLMKKKNWKPVTCIALLLVIGLAHFSGATLRRPNVSIWLSLVLALIYYVTEVRREEA